MGKPTKDDVLVARLFDELVDHMGRLATDEVLARQEDGRELAAIEAMRSDFAFRHALTKYETAKAQKQPEVMAQTMVANYDLCLHISQQLIRGRGAPKGTRTFGEQHLVKQARQYSSILRNLWPSLNAGKYSAALSEKVIQLLYQKILTKPVVGKNGKVVQRPQILPPDWRKQH
jgi:hypothetical protein